MDKDSYFRVTNILYPFSGLDKIDPSIVSRAAERGTKVHKICEGIIQGFGEFGVEKETEPYVESFKKWWGKGHEFVAMEKRFWCDELRVTGQVDLILKGQESNDGLAVVDLKTSSKPSPTWKAQGSAYAYLAKKAGYDIRNVHFIHLLKSGKEAKIYEYPVDDGFFLDIYKVWNYFFNGGKK